MISRLTACAAIFAIAAAACVAFGAEARQASPAAARATVVATPTIYTLPRVEITGHRHAGS